VAIEEHLEPGEPVLAACDNFYATDRRLIRYEARRRRSRAHTLAYRQVSSVISRSSLRKQTIVLALLVALLTVSIGPAGAPKLILLLLALVAAVFALLNRWNFLEFRGSSLSRRRQARWRLTDGGREEALELAETVRAHLGDKASTLPQVTPQPAVRLPRSHRSVLLLPAHRADQLSSALDLRPDALCLDLASSSDPSEREMARQLAWGEVTAASKSHCEVLVRISPDQPSEDLGVAAWPGLSGVVASVESVGELHRLESDLQTLETARALPTPIKLLAHISTAQGLASAAAIAAASPRVVALILGAVDLLEETPDDVALSIPKEAPLPPGVQLLGLLGAGIPPGRLEEALGGQGPARLLAAAQRARDRGFHGALTPHPAGIGACHQAFGGPDAPSPTVQPRPFPLLLSQGLTGPSSDSSAARSNAVEPNSSLQPSPAPPPTAGFSNAEPPGPPPRDASACEPHP
jgi:citrate lyase subunit beta/citryl-CoA lyase